MSLIYASVFLCLSFVKYFVRSTQSTFALPLDNFFEMSCFFGSPHFIECGRFRCPPTRRNDTGIIWSHWWWSSRCYSWNHGWHSTRHITGRRCRSGILSVLGRIQARNFRKTLSGDKPREQQQHPNDGIKSRYPHCVHSVILMLYFFLQSLQYHTIPPHRKCESRKAFRWW
jgi:hypothetical protein